MRMTNITLIILSIIFLAMSGVFLYIGINYILGGNILGAIGYMFMGLVLLFLGGLIVYGAKMKP